MPALGTCPVRCLGHARSWDTPFTMLGACLLLGHALQNNAWDRHVLGTDMPSKMLEACSLSGHAPQNNAWDGPALGAGPSKCLGQALQNAWDRPALGTCPLKCLGQARSWAGPSKCLGQASLIHCHARHLAAFCRMTMGSTSQHHQGLTHAGAPPFVFSFSFVSFMG